MCRGGADVLLISLMACVRRRVMHRRWPSLSATQPLPDDEEIAVAVKGLNARAPAPKAAPAKRSGLFWRTPKAEPTPPASTNVAAKDRPVDVRSAPNLPPQRKRARAPERRPPRPRPVRTRSRWRWFPLVTKLAIGVVIATFLVRLQQSLPHFEFRSSGTVASSPDTASQDVANRPDHQVQRRQNRESV